MTPPIAQSSNSLPVACRHRKRAGGGPPKLVQLFNLYGQSMSFIPRIR